MSCSTINVDAWKHRTSSVARCSTKELLYFRSTPYTTLALPHRPVHAYTHSLLHTYPTQLKQLNTLKYTNLKQVWRSPGTPNKAYRRVCKERRSTMPREQSLTRMRTSCSETIKYVLRTRITWNIVIFRVRIEVGGVERIADLRNVRWSEGLYSRT
jgi:hypothetical protein